MDWASIITALIAALVPTGGIAALVTLREKRAAAQLENDAKVIANWEKIAEERTKRAAELKGDLDRKEDIIQEQWREISDLHRVLDLTRSRLVAATIMRCTRISCTDGRRPPWGSVSEADILKGLEVDNDYERKRDSVN